MHRIIADQPVREKPDRAQSDRADRGPDTLNIGTPAAAPQGPVTAFTAFVQLIDALAEHDGPAVDRARRDLRTRGFDVRPLNTPPRRGGR